MIRKRRARLPRRRVLVLAPTVTLTGLLLIPTQAGAILGCGLNPFCIGGKVAGAGVTAIAGDAITALAQSVLQALGQAVEWTATLWMGIGMPQLADGSGQPVGAVAFVQDNLAYFTAGLAVFSVLVGAGKIAWEEQKAHHARELARFLVVYGMIAVGSAALGSTLVYACDQVASDVISQATANTSFAAHMAQLLGIGPGGVAGAAGLSGLLSTAFAAIVLGIMAFLTTLVQILLMFVRDGMVVLLIGILPLAAAMSNTEMGMQWLKKSWAWLIAFALYKPAAAVVYAVAFVLPGQNGIDALMSGIMMLILAILALPALLRFVVPATAAVAGGGGTGGFASGMAGSMLGTRMPSGAAQISQASTGSYDQTQTSPPGNPSGSTLAHDSGSGGGGGGTNGSSGPAGAFGGAGAGGQNGSGSANGNATAGSAGGGVYGGSAASGAAAGGGGGGGGAAAGGAAAGGGGAAAGGVGYGAGKLYEGYQAGGAAADQAVRSSDQSTNGNGNGSGSGVGEGHAGAAGGAPGPAPGEQDDDPPGSEGRAG